MTRILGSVAAIVAGLVIVFFALSGHSLSTVVTEISIAKPIEEVYAFVTTPVNWPLWHPSSEDVRGEIDHSLEVGEVVIEDFVVAGRSGTVAWTVTDRDEPSRWVIDGIVEGRDLGGLITYTLSPIADGTTFHRQFVYDVPNRFYGLLDRLVVNRRIKQESHLALTQLKEALE